MLIKLLQSSRKKTSLLISIGMGVALSLLLIPIILISIDIVVKNGEKRFTQLEVLRVENIIQNEIYRTSSTLSDWSDWNDTYQFVQDGNQKYIDNNLSDESISNLNINYFLILNTSHQIIYQKYIDSITQTSTESPIDIESLLKKYNELSSTHQKIRGYIYDQGHAMFVVSNPILTSGSEGPSQGTIIFIKFFDRPTLDNLLKLSLRKIDFISISDLAENPAKIPEESVLNNQVFTLPRDGNTIVGYKYIDVIQNNPTMILQVENPRDLYQQGRTTEVIISSILLCLLVLFSIISYYLATSILEGRERKKEKDLAAKLLEESRQNNLELEKRVAERTKELEIRNKDLETFNYTVSHDLKAPLRGISGYSTLLIYDHAAQLNDKGKEYLQKLVESANRMGLLIDDLLSYTKTERRKIIKSEVNLEEIIDTLLLEYHEDLSIRNFKIIKEIECKQLIVDRDGITLILRNLLDNAVKFTRGKEKPEIILGSIRDDSKYLISVSDNGVGFDLKFHEKIFEIFQRLFLPEEYPGTGIGLALVKKTVESLGGKIYAQSEVGVGSTFNVEIPLEHSKQLIHRN